MTDTVQRPLETERHGEALRFRLWIGRNPLTFSLICASAGFLLGRSASS